MQASPARFNRWILVVAGLGFLIFLGILAYGKQFVRLPSLNVMGTSTTPPASTVRLPDALQPQARPVVAAPAPTAPVEATPAPPPAVEPPTYTAGVPPAPPAPPSGLEFPAVPTSSEDPARGQAPRGAGGRQGRRRAPPQEQRALEPPTPAPAKKAWRMNESSTAVGKSPFDNEREESHKEQETKLIEEAQWVRAADITKVLYRNQVIPIMTLGAVNSDIPDSDVTLLVTRNVYDRWMTKVLLPHNTRLIAKTSAAKVEPGQEGLPMSIEEGHYPDGTILHFKQAKVHDRSGQAGLRGEVDNHIVANLAYAGIAALLNIGIRGAAGSPSGFQENLPQQYAAQIGQSVTSSATRMIEQRVPRNPTIREKAGAEGFVSLQVNIDLSTVPVTKR